MDASNTKNPQFKELTMEENKNLSVLIARPLSEFPLNFVHYRDSSNCLNKVFCEGVSALNGWITMYNVRVEIDVCASIEPIKKVIWWNYGSDFKTESHKKSQFREQAYRTIANRIIPEKTVQTINSYEEGSDIALWALTSKEDGINKANEAVKIFNEKTLKENSKKFTEIVDFRLKRHLDIKYNNLPWWRKKFTKKHEWKEEQQTLPEFKKIIEDIIEETKKYYQDNNIEYEGTLEYEPEDNT